MGLLGKAGKGWDPRVKVIGEGGLYQGVQHLHPGGLVAKAEKEGLRLLAKEKVDKKIFPTAGWGKGEVN